MAQKIYKYKLEDSGKTMLALPENAQILHVSAIGTTAVFLWALIDDTETLGPRFFDFYCTGEVFPEDGAVRIFINTFIVPTYNEVYHAFEITLPIEEKQV